MLSKVLEESADELEATGDELDDLTDGEEAEQSSYQVELRKEQERIT